MTPSRPTLNYFFFITVFACFSARSFAEPTTFQLSFRGQAWQAVPEVNNVNPKEKNYFVPIKVIQTEVRLIDTDTNMVLEVLFGESNCTKTEHKAWKITSAECPLRKNGKRALYNLEIWKSSGDINVTKVRDVKPHEKIVINS